MWAHRTHRVERCPKCGSEMGKNDQEWLCIKCNYRKPKTETHVPENGLRGRYVLSHTPRLGSSIETSLNEPGDHDVNWRYVSRLKHAKKGYVKSLSRNPREKNLWYFTHRTALVTLK